MKKVWITIAIIAVIAIIGFFAFRWFNNTTTPNNIADISSVYNATRTTGEAQDGQDRQTMQNQQTQSSQQNSNNQNGQNSPTSNAQQEQQATETELHSFSTPIKTDDDNRLTNIKITCSRINKTIVKAGKEFSFCDVVGQPSSADGYKPADAFGKDNKIIKAIGGGNCQVSTTVYNAALGVDGLKITERHEHDRDVAYVKDGKDATVAYDYLDLKFKNNNDFDIKLYSFVSDNKVVVKIFKLS